MKKIFLLLCIPFLMAGSCKIKPDTSELSAVQARDLTLILSGCGEGYREGMLLCRVSEGAQPSTKIRLTMPPIKCKRENCVALHVVRKDGSIHPLGGIKRGETQLTVKLSDLVGSNADLSKDDGGPYRILAEAYFQVDREEYKVLAEGITYLVILKAGYVALGCNAPDLAWSVQVSKNCQVNFTTKMRTSLCGSGCN